MLIHVGMNLYVIMREKSLNADGKIDPVQMYYLTLSSSLGPQKQQLTNNDSSNNKKQVNIQMPSKYNVTKENILKFPEMVPIIVTVIKIIHKNLQRIFCLPRTHLHKISYWLSQSNDPEIKFTGILIFLFVLYFNCTCVSV